MSNREMLALWAGFLLGALISVGRYRMIVVSELRASARAAGIRPTSWMLLFGGIESVDREFLRIHNASLRSRR